MADDMKPLDEDAAELLNIRMRTISEDHWCAGWLIGLEFNLWAMVQGGDRRFGLGVVEEADVAKLRRLSHKCGGWFYWLKEDGAERFVPLAYWEPIYRAHVEATPTRFPEAPPR